MDLDIWIPILTIVILGILNCPLWLSFTGGVIVYFLFLHPELVPQILAQRMVSVAEGSTYMAIPYFVTAGCLMNYSGIAKRLMDLADGLVGHLRGGLGHVNVVLSLLMGGVSGSSAADAAMECKILVPEMVRRGYDKEYSAAVTLSSSMVTPIIPPGMGLILFAFVTQTSVGRLLAAGYIPGLLCGLAFMGYVAWYSKKNNLPRARETRATARELLKLSLDGLWALLMPFGLIMGLRFGLFTATEAGAFCAVYSFIVGKFIYKELKMKHLWPIIKESVEGTATIMMLICSANVLSYYLTYERIPAMLSDFILSLNLSGPGFMFLTTLLLLIVGMFLESSPSILILGPLLTPIAVSLGVDATHFGLVFCFCVAIGAMSPPFGVVLYQVAGLTGVNLGKLIKTNMPFLIIMIILAFLFAFIPQITLVIPDLIYG